ncbi:M14 family zinc carboxypeptidase [Marinicella sediminis]|uniref:M14 family zinc carboxypeptidase n=1 Tax=Marinicella sediminis TaxID=1792834 RepID=A0ABV7J5Z0_9GAMM|nr:M14 family zinc carboxypeptidase [Marinicella sediminis]
MTKTAQIQLISLLLMTPALSTASQNPSEWPDNPPWVVMADYPDKASVLDLKEDIDFWKLDEKNKTVLLMVKSHQELNQLKSLGFRLRLSQPQMDKHLKLLHNERSNNIRTIDNFPCYRTVQETYDAMANMASTYPDLVSLVDIGDSWHKETPGGDAGYDMQVVKITNQNLPLNDKPVLYAMGSIHAREYPPAELVTRFAEYLLSQYGQDADVTWLVDYHEIHLLLQGNPDGRTIAQTEPFANQRKNMNENHCLNGNQQGVDMNRNFLFRWNEGTGSSDNDCSQVFRGESAVSEPETEAINEYIKTLFPDDRPDDLVTPAPLTKPGVYLDIHNVAELILFPFGYANGAGQAPNHDQLMTLARRMAYYSNYRPEQSNATLGGADGASDDNAYGTLGVAAYTIELGEGDFYSSCDAFENTIYPDNLPALIYAAKASRMPYVLASGPDVTNLPDTPVQVETGGAFVIAGTATDLQFNSSNGSEPTHNITAVNAYLAMPSWDGTATAVSLSASDGNFNSKTENFNGTVATAGLSEGRYTLWLEATDATGTTGVPSAVFVDVIDPANIGTVSGQVTDALTGAPVAQALLSYAGIQDSTDQQGQYSIQTAATTSDLNISKLGYFSQSLAAVQTTGGLVTNRNIVLQPVCEQSLLADDVDDYANINEAISEGGWSVDPPLGSNDFRVETGDDHSTGSANSFVSTNEAVVTDKSLMTIAMTLPVQAELQFWHKHQFESGNADYDGGVIEISTNAGTDWQDLGSYITQNGYNGTLSGGFDNPLGGRQAFTGSLGVFTEVKVDLAAFANESVMIRWRMGTDNTQGAGDWKIDDVHITAAGVCELSDLIFIDGFNAQP